MKRLHGLLLGTACTASLAVSDRVDYNHVKELRSSNDGAARPRSSCSIYTASAARYHMCMVCTESFKLEVKGTRF